MNKQEAIEWLKSIRRTSIFEQVEAIDMAIEALQVKTDGDTISRQDALKPFCIAPDGTRIPEVDCDNFPVEFSVEFIKKHLLSLPSADRPTVDKEYLIDLIQEAVYDGEACAKLMDLVDRPQGEWIFNPKDAIELMFTKPKCSECGFESSDGGNYCPTCGARMFR